MMNAVSIGILGVLGINLDKMGHGHVRIVKNRDLEKVSLIQHKLISGCIIFS